ncbi:Uncharacterised protein [Brevundimonas vesicularis]|uniref:Uncharacterized protein n=1 Tax=Brevundimonas vesicularis TaxID=41276 RepID=A0A2X1BPI5_BREVE|nr:Uncharacterised protein [Brevundimonas vesicularis]
METLIMPAESWIYWELGPGPLKPETYPVLKSGD